MTSAILLTKGCLFIGSDEPYTFLNQHEISPKCFDDVQAEAPEASLPTPSQEDLTAQGDIQDAQFG